MRRLLPLLFALAALLTGCTTAPTGRVSVPAVPAWQAPADARTYTIAQVVEAIVELAPTAAIETSDLTFTAVSHAWLEQAAAWSWEFGKATDLGSFQAESWDCDKFALGFALAANVAAKRAGVKAQPLLARVHVFQTAPFGGVQAGGGHAVNGFYSDRPPHFWVFEPQTRTLVPFREYPNRANVFRVKLGG